MNKYKEELIEARAALWSTARSTAATVEWGAAWASECAAARAAKWYAMDAVEWTVVWAADAGQSKQKQIELILKRIKK